MGSSVERFKGSECWRMMLVETWIFKHPSIVFQTATLHSARQQLAKIVLTSAGSASPLKMATSRVRFICILEIYVQWTKDTHVWVKHAETGVWAPRGNKGWCLSERLTLDFEIRRAPICCCAALSQTLICRLRCMLSGRAPVAAHAGNCRHPSFPFVSPPRLAADPGGVRKISTNLECSGLLSSYSTPRTP